MYVCEWFCEWDSGFVARYAEYRLTTDFRVLQQRFIREIIADMFDVCVNTNMNIDFVNEWSNDKIGFEQQMRPLCTDRKFIAPLSWQKTH